MKIKTKFKIIIYTNLLIIIWFFVLRTFTMNQFKTITNGLRYLNEFAILINKHQQFINKLEYQLNTENYLTLNTDPEKCPLGIWLKSDTAKSITDKIPKTKPVFKKLDSLHRLIHQDVIILNNYLKTSPNDKTLAFNYFKNRTLQHSKDFIQTAVIIEKSILKKNQEVRKRLFLINSIGFVALISALFILIFMSKRTHVQLERNMEIFSKASQSLAKGKLSTRFTISSSDELAIIASQINQALESISANLSQVLDFTSQVAFHSEELSKSAQLLADNASSQAVAVEQISSLMDQMNAIIAQNASKTKKTEEITNQATENLDRAKSMVKHIIDLINEIAQKTKSISKISSRIDLLAVNTSIEAARASEHGKGFKVIATEIRRLADNTKKTADNIILSTQKGVQNTDSIIKNSKEIFINLNQVINFIKDFALSIEEQSQGIQSVTDGVQHLSASAQENAAMAEQLANTAQELKQQAHELKQSLNFFSI